MSDAAQRRIADVDQASRLAAIEARVDALVPADGQSQTPWFKNPSFIISLAAFLISIVTTVASAYRTYREDVEAQKAQLRAVFSQLNSVELRAAEYAAKFSNHPALANIRSTLNTQNMFLAKQAYTLVKEIGDDASAIDLAFAGYAVANVGEMALGEELEIKALEKARNATEYIGAARALGAMKLATQHIPDAEKYRQMALHAFELFPKDAINEHRVNEVHAWTQLYWATNSTDCARSLAHVADANAYIEALGVHVPPELVQWRNKINQTCSQAGTPLNTAADLPGRVNAR